MPMIDNQVSFVGLGAAAASLVGAAGALVQVGDVIDLLGVGVGVAPPSIIGNRASGFYGVDPGVGRTKPRCAIYIGTSLATGNSATAEFALQYAPDTGSSGGYLPGTWEDGATGGAKAVAEYAAGVLAQLDLPPAPPSTQTPRFVRLVMRVPASTNLSAGTVIFAGLVMGLDEQAQRQAPNNYTAL